MSSPRIAVGTILVGTLMFAAGVWKGTAPLPPVPTTTYDWSTTTVSGPYEGPRPAREMERERLVDRYGNELHRAVGDYRIDYRGDVYERHSPNTALLKLAPPEA